MSLFTVLTAIALFEPSFTRAEATLRELAANHDLRFGTAAPRVVNDPALKALLGREFSSLTPENSMKFDSLQPEPGKFRFEESDALVSFAKGKNMEVRGHALAWHRQLPKWVEQEKNPEKLRAILKDHIQTTVRYYKEKFPGVVRSWDVVNEAVGDDGTLRDSPWSRIGMSKLAYISLAFHWAHEADPDAKLFYNDYGAEDTGAKSRVVYGLLKKLKQDGVPVHGVGMQMHFGGGRGPDANDVRRNMERLAKLGLEVHVTEMDVPLPAKHSLAELAWQAERYAAMLGACLSIAACKSFTVWGPSDAHSWIPKENPGFGSALLFDEKLRAKPAYERLTEMLRAGPLFR